MNDDMNDDNELDPVARLRAADPAAGLEPRGGFTDDVVARSMADDGAEQARSELVSSESAPSESTVNDPAPGQPAPVAELSAERARRRPRWLPFAAVAASIALVGGAGFGLGASTAEASKTTTAAAPPISLQAGAGVGAGAGGAASEAGVGPNGAAGSMGTQGKIAGGAASDMRYPFGFGRNSFSSTGLSSTAGTSAAYTFDARAASSADTVAALAAALGVAGTPEKKDGSWQVGPQDGTAPSLLVGLDGTLNFYFSNPQINPWACDSGAEATEPCAPPTTLPSEDTAKDALRSLITAAGRDPGTFEFTSDTWDGSFTRMAQAWPVVDGRRIDQAWSVELTDAGVYSASGALAGLVSIGDYAIVSEKEGFERLSDPRFGASMTAMPMSTREVSDAGTTEWVPPTEPPATPTAGTSLSWPVNSVKIVSARLGLASQWQPNGSVLVVPAYEFTDADGGTWSVVAVADSLLDFATN